MNQVKLAALYDFLRSTRGNWRNSVHIDCGNCPHGRQSQGVLMAPSADGNPVLIPAAVLLSIGEDVDTAECLLSIDCQTFESLFSLWLAWTADSATECPIRQAVGKAGWEMPCNA